jgi:hypothetical protein
LGIQKYFPYCKNALAYDTAGVLVFNSEVVGLGQGFQLEKEVLALVAGQLFGAAQRQPSTAGIFDRSGTDDFPNIFAKKWRKSWHL